MFKLKRNQSIKYINPEIPDFQLPEIRGSSYNRQVPDTLDLAERARHAIHGMTATTDLQYNAEIYWRVCFGWKPIEMYHDWNDHVEYKYYAPCAMLRQVCGSEENRDVDWHWMANLLQMVGPDGLFYTPQIGRPWGKIFGSGGEMYTTEVGDQMMDVAMSGRCLESAVVFGELTGDSRWITLARNAISGLRKMVVDKGDYAYFDKLMYHPGEKATELKEFPLPKINHGYIWLGHGLITCYRMTGDEQALDLGYKLARCFSLGLSGWVGSNGEFRLFPDDSDVNNPLGPVHFHTNTLIRMLMLDAGIAKGDKEMIEIAQKGYQYGKNNGESDVLMGYFPETLGYNSKWCRKTLEICEVADMIYLGLRQSTTGIADCWDDVDRWLRNAFAEMQLLDTDWPYEYSDKHGELKQEPFNPQYVTGEKVPERCRGTWAGWAAANDFQSDIESSIMACCVGNASMQLYRLWRDMISCDEDNNRLTINLLLNRASSWADIDSHIPYKGQVDINLKRNCELAIRIPEWTSPGNCVVTVNDQDKTPQWQGRYAVIKAAAEDVVKLKCPINERTTKLNIVKKDYQAIVRGNEIVNLNPAGTHHPLYQRDKYRQDETKWKKVERFVPEKNVSLY